MAETTPPHAAVATTAAVTQKKKKKRPSTASTRLTYLEVPLIVFGVLHLFLGQTQHAVRIPEAKLENRKSKTHRRRKNTGETKEAAVRQTSRKTGQRIKRAVVGPRQAGMCIDTDCVGDKTS